MGRKRFFSGLIILVIGIVLVLIALNAMHKIAEAKGITQDIENFFEHNPSWNPIIEFFGGTAQHKISEYDTPALLALILGIVLTIAGAITTYTYRKKK